MFDTLSFSGGLLCVDDKRAAYTFGEMLNERTLVIHIEKAHAEYGGSYQAINNYFLKNCCADAVYINREQDLRIEGLRRAKESYKPIRMNKKSIIYKKVNK
ncbi:MAG: phosphatidylglycerol lysyltransferase domain-containing protein [Candidatus Odinarchaeota archaeon]